MLRIVLELVPEMWDEAKEEFIPPVVQTLELEHSLVSLSKWESKYCKPFLSKGDKSTEEVLDYIQFMTLTPNVDPVVYGYLTNAHIDEIQRYIEAPMTAAVVPETKGNGGNQDTIVSELIYYWMFSLGIPLEFENLHLNRLLSQVKVCNFKNQPPKKMSQQEIMAQHKALNEARKKKYNTKG